MQHDGLVNIQDASPPAATGSLMENVLLQQHRCNNTFSREAPQALRSQRSVDMEGGAALVGIVLVSHGLLADGLKDAAEMIVGPQERFLAIGMGHAADLDDLRSRIEAAVTRVAGDSGALVLVDLMGGSPSNASGYLAHSGTQVICGVNLPMLLEVLTQREGATVEELTEIAMQAAKDGLVNLTQLLAGK